MRGSADPERVRRLSPRRVSQIPKALFRLILFRQVWPRALDATWNKDAGECKVVITVRLPDCPISGQPPPMHRCRRKADERGVGRVLDCIATLAAVASLGHAQYTITSRSRGISVRVQSTSSRSIGLAPGMRRPSSFRCVRERTSRTSGSSPRFIMSSSSVTLIRAARRALRNRQRFHQRYDAYRATIPATVPIA